MRYDASVNGAPAKPISGTSGRSAARASADRLVDVVERRRRRRGVSRSTSAARAHRAVDHGAVAARRTRAPTPSGSSTSRMSAKMMAASTPSCSTGRDRHLGRGVGRLAELEEARACSRTARYSGMVAAGLAHEPDRRVGGGLAAARREERRGTATPRQLCEGTGDCKTTGPACGVRTRVRRQVTSGPILGGEASRCGWTPCASSASVQTGPIGRLTTHALERGRKRTSIGGDAEDVLDWTRCVKTATSSAGRSDAAARRAPRESAGSAQRTRGPQHARGRGASMLLRRAPPADTPYSCTATSAPVGRPTPSRTAGAPRQVCGGGTGRRPPRRARAAPRAASARARRSATRVAPRSRRGAAVAEQRPRARACRRRSAGRRRRRRRARGARRSSQSAPRSPAGAPRAAREATRHQRAVARRTRVVNRSRSATRLEARTQAD